MDQAEMLVKSGKVSSALTPNEFTTAMAQLGFAPDSKASIAVAVSGGPDSMALAYCLQRWRSSPPLVAFIVDHALRDTSRSEAEATQQQLGALGIPSEILTWTHAPITSALHIKARQARYDLMRDACRRHNIAHLCLGHQRQDQAETILMRLAKGSGIDGLSGIAAIASLGDVQLLRPLLEFNKDRLLATCISAGISFVQDPSNEADRFARGRLRKVMPLLADEGLSIERLCDLGARAREAKDALDFYVRNFLARHATRDITGALHLDLVSYRDLPRAVALRVLTTALLHLHPDAYAPEYVSLARLHESLCADMQPAALQACRISANTKNITIMREASLIKHAPLIAPGQTLLWDQRWLVTLDPKTTAGDYVIAPLGAPAHAELDRLAPSLRKLVPQGRARASLPALWPNLKTWKGPKPELIAIALLNPGEPAVLTAELAVPWPPQKLASSDKNP